MNAGIVAITSGLGSGGMIMTSAAGTPSGTIISLSGQTVTTSGLSTSPFVINPVFASSITNLGSVLRARSKRR